MQHESQGVGSQASSPAPVPEKDLPATIEGAAPVSAPVPEIGGPGGPEPTRFGDWEKNGRCIDF
jgi:hypothetical protein